MSAAIEKLAAPAFSDDALALDFTRRYGDRLRYVATWGKWLEYDGTRWTPDATVQVFDLARVVCREMATTCNKEGEAKKLASAPTVAAVERLARSDRQHAATVAQWDADPWALNTPNGTVDLQTGDLRRHDRNDHLTKITAVGPSGTCPLWLEFLRRITDGDDDLIAFMKRMIGALRGYCEDEERSRLFSRLAEALKPPPKVSPPPAKRCSRRRPNGRDDKIVRLFNDR